MKVTKSIKVGQGMGYNLVWNGRAPVNTWRENEKFEKTKARHNECIHEWITLNNHELIIR